jgi:predicted nucleic acid-binding protein
MTTFLDTNVLVYLTTPADPHHAWALNQLEACKAEGPAIIADMVYCEFSVVFPSKADVDAVVAAFALERYPTSDKALFRAGKAFKEYRARQGTKDGVLPDFLIGAIAEEAGAPLVTVNSKDFLGYFPTVRLISPP